MATLVLVDGPNTYNDIDRWFRSSQENAAEETIHGYFEDWFDFDRLVAATLGLKAKTVGVYGTQDLGTVVFHSDKAIGRGASRLKGAVLDKFWGRQASGDGTSTMLVTVPGYQPTKMLGRCKKCDRDVEMEARGEKGVDTSMVTYLYEAAESWSSAVLFTNDADFVPPILALRRRGKRVFVAAVDSHRDSALKRASQTFFGIPQAFLQSDFDVFRLLQPDGPVDHMLRKFTQAYENDIWISTDGTACPMVTLNESNDSQESFIQAALGSEWKIEWFTMSRGAGNWRRDGRILYNSGFQLGAGLLRHLEGFDGALWRKYWRRFS